MFALAAIYSMKDTGRAVVMLPEGSLSSQASGSVAARTFMVESGNLDCVVKLPERMLERTGINVSLLVFSRKENRKSIRMVDASGLVVKGRRFNTIAPEDIDKIVSAVYGFADRSGWGAEHTKNVGVDEILKNGCILSATRYFSAGDMPAIENAVRFGEVANQISRGATIGSKDLDDLVAHDDGTCYYLSPGNIVNGVISDDLTGMKEIPKGAPVLEDGDLVLLRTGAPNKVAVFEGHFDKPVIASSNLFICRLNKDKVNPWFLKSFFESADGEQMLNSIAVGTAIRSISRKALEELPVPCPPLERQQELASVYRAKLKEIGELEKKLRTLRRELGKVYENGK
jgi:type I restriction enzyme M protein